MTKLQEGKEFDLLVVGGGATGAGIALDAATRGLNIALVEKYDFSSGTSSRSTKLVHGGVRYLEKVRDYSFAWGGPLPRCVTNDATYVLTIRPSRTWTTSSTRW